MEGGNLKVGEQRPKVVYLRNCIEILALWSDGGTTKFKSKKTGSIFCPRKSDHITVFTECTVSVFVKSKAVCPSTVCLLHFLQTSFKFADLAPHFEEVIFFINNAQVLKIHSRHGDL